MLDRGRSTTKPSHAGNQPANIRVNNRRYQVASLFILWKHKRQRTHGNNGVKGVLFSIDTWQTYQGVRSLNNGLDKTELGAKVR